MSKNSDKKYVSKMPKLMILILMNELMQFLKEVNVTALNKKIPGDERADMISGMFIEPENMMHLMVVKALHNAVSQEPKEIKALEKEMDDYQEYYEKDINDSWEIVANIEMETFLHSLGIKPNNDARDIN